MDLAAHAGTERRVDQPVAGERELAAKGFGHDGGLEMDAVVTLHVGGGAGEAGFYQFADLFRGHGGAAGRMH